MSASEVNLRSFKNKPGRVDDRKPGMSTRPAVLVVEDDARLRAAMRRFLEEAAFSVIEATDGREAVSGFQWEADPMVLVILDVMMPNLDGAAALREIRRLGASCPVLICSGLPREILSKRFEGLGVSGFLTKPFGPGELIEAVQRSLDHLTPTVESA